MHKFILGSLLLLGVTQAHAQYFQSAYSTGSDYHEMQFGVNTRFIGNGHLMSGAYMNYNLTPFLNPIVTKTDADGFFATPNDFANVYQLDIAGQPLMCNRNEAFELDPLFFPNERYIMTGEAFLPGCGTSYLYVQSLDASGNPATPSIMFSPYIPSIPIQRAPVVHFNNARLSNAGTEVYLTGSLVFTEYYPALVYTFVTKVDLTSMSVLWTSQFLVNNTRDNPLACTGWDIIESPYNGEVIVVGDTYFPVEGANGYIQRLNASTGSLSGMALLYATPAANTIESFRSIDIMNNTGISGNSGFVIGGVTNADNPTLIEHQIQFLCFIDQNLTPLSSVTLTLPTALPTDYHTLGQVKERLDQNGDYNYYTAGSHIDINTMGNVHSMMIQQFNSAAFATNTYLYGSNGNPGDAAQGYALDFYDGVNPVIGVAAYGNTQGSLTAGGTRDFYLVKSYFNGVSGCYENLNYGLATGTAPNVVGSIFASGGGATYTGTTTPFNTTIVSNLFNSNFCYSTSIPGGSNARSRKVSNDPKGDNQLNREIPATFSLGKIAPNPPGRNDAASISVNSNNALPVRIIISDVLGRTWDMGSFNLEKGENSLKLDIRKLNLKHGIYVISVENGTEKQNTMLYIE